MARKKNDDGDVLSFSESVGKFVVDHPWLTTSIVGTVVGGVTTCIRGYKPIVFPTQKVAEITDKKEEEPVETPEEESFED